MIEKGKPGSARAAIMRMLDAHPEGLTSNEIAAALEIGQSNCKKHLMRLRDEGLSRFIGNTFVGGWCATQHVATTTARCRQTDESREKVRVQIKRWRDSERQRQRQRGEETTWFERQPVHLLVNARDAPPLGRVGPRSVFDVAT